MASIEEELDSKFPNDIQRFVVNLVYTGTWIKNTVNDFLKPYGISEQQFNILRILRGAKDWLPMSEVKKRMVDKSPNATRLVDKMLTKNIIERRRSSEDRRVVYVKITKEGLGLLAEIDKADGQKGFDFLTKVTAEEARIASDIIDKMRD